MQCMCLGGRGRGKGEGPGKGEGATDEAVWENRMHDIAVSFGGQRKCLLRASWDL